VNILGTKLVYSFPSRISSAENYLSILDEVAM